MLDININRTWMESWTLTLIEAKLINVLNIDINRREKSKGDAL